MMNLPATITFLISDLPNDKIGQTMAYCLDFDIQCAGENYADARYRLLREVEKYVDYMQRAWCEDWRFPAPFDYWEMLKKARIRYTGEILVNPNDAGEKILIFDADTRKDRY